MDGHCSLAYPVITNVRIDFQFLEIFVFDSWTWDRQVIFSITRMRISSVSFFWKSRDCILLEVTIAGQWFTLRLSNSFTAWFPVPQSDLEPKLITTTKACDQLGTMTMVALKNGAPFIRMGTLYIRTSSKGLNNHVHVLVYSNHYTVDCQVLLHLIFKH